MGCPKGQGCIHIHIQQSMHVYTTLMDGSMDVGTQIFGSRHLMIVTSKLEGPMGFLKSQAHEEYEQACMRKRQDRVRV